MKAFTLLGLGTFMVISAVSCGGVTSLGENEAGSTQGDGTDDGMTTDPGTDPNGMGTDPGMGGIDPGTGTDPGMGGGTDPNAGACMSSADCPVLLGPCEICPDGTAACPGAECVNGQCESYYTSCGGMGPNCQTDSDCAVLGAPCEMCADGTVSCPQTWCNMGVCEGVYQSCGGGGVDPCAGKGCGDSCNLCDPMDPNCAQIEVLLVCDAYGQCGPGAPECNSMGGQCTSAMDCPYSLAVCQVCPDGSAACPTTDCIMGTCVTEFPTCQDPNPQPGACMTDSECPQLDGPCQMCPDGTSACPGSYCLNGQCILSFPACGGGGMYDPCENKSCGDACTLCPPDDMTCVETQELKACDLYGACSSAPVACAMP